MLTIVGEAFIDLVFVGAVMAIVSSLAYLLTLTARERRESRREVAARPPQSGGPRVRRVPEAQTPRSATSLRPGVARHQVTPSG